MDPYSLYMDQDPAVFLNADSDLHSDPAAFCNADPDPTLKSFNTKLHTVPYEKFSGVKKDKKKIA